ncbi:cation:proton antiporter [Aliikangiella marina]|uniref:Cation:proton antiporter n=1 Tax=Aliikangiella marina TaxID=1712262 RepID=A0A545TJ95_9GAMM|nr:cation:proton antiporter [Aliikangiella marina]TQV77246.1 cation:proton antiporter [Aliikangiella marina]
MDISSFLLQLLAILLSARILGELAASVQIPSVIGELAAGIVIGPSLLGWIEADQVIRLMAEIGVILLLFQVGLETDMGKLIRTGVKSTIVAFGGFIAPFAAGFVTCFYFFNLNLLVSLFVGGTLTATSIGITVRTLSDIHKQNSVEGQITLGAAVLDDILGVVLLALLYEFTVTGDVSWINTTKVFLFIGVFFLLAPPLAKLISHFIQYLDKRIDNPGLIPSTIISLVLFFAWLSHAVGAPELLGGFAAGLALSRRFFLPFGLAIKTEDAFSQRIDKQMTPIIHLFTPIFFVTVGLSLDLRAIDWSSPFFWWFSLILLAVAIVSKFFGAFFIKEPWARKVVVGMAMVPRGEVGLIFAGLGSAAGVFDKEVYTSLIMVIAYTTLLSPFWIKLYYKRFRVQLDEIETLVPREDKHSQKIRNH